MKNATRFLVISLALMLSGCAYSPKQVEASRPLVNPAASTTLQTMSANLQQPLNTLPQGAALSANGNTYILGQRYVSALGLECIELLRNRNYNQSQHGVTCKSGDTWYLVPQLEQASASNLLAVQ
ncbi:MULTISPECIES: hypothetical protein [Leclercia]|jgi:hypothetical protein|uniref:Lipoprotein n=1 Tax=Leclercia adecarboxylata TaxID=83655 RepID=A0A3E1ZVY5_9ENTR|nr:MULTISPECIES: hypothetical protein [Leclercia]POW71000.1 hypothetical protein C3373_10755 [Leclercia sp. LSNIH4]HBB6760892.1 hypothetical protein [Citrobacter amalonaticus]ALZ98055.1 hypothetical protein APT61_19375 [Leclercia adecarboxylata]AUY38862.1 hypothetical protein C3F35_08750 [Leclercia sp. LSNIH3]MBM6636253.1 hypothetical protein [Leclercia adecarboxylata]